MKTNRLLFIYLTCLLSTQLYAQAEQETIVRSYVETLSSWCKTGNDKNREVLARLTKEDVGSNEKEGLGCRVKNKLMKQLDSFMKANHPNNTIELGEGDLEISTYLNYFTWAIEEGLSYTHGAPVWQKDFEEPVAYNDKNEAPLFVFDVDEKTKGVVDFSGRTQYWVRGDQITYVTDHDDPMAQAMAFYSHHEYEKAFRLFREQAYTNPKNYMAQYYTAVMEVKKQGCDFLNSKVRDTEAAWWITRGTITSNYKMMNLFEKFGIDTKKLPFNSISKNLFYYRLRMTKLVSQGMMPAMKVVNKNKVKYGFMNERGEIIIPCKYNYVESFNNNGLAMVRGDKGTGFVNKQGNEVIPTKYQGAWPKFNNGRTYVLLDGKLLLIDEKGNIIKEAGKGFDLIIIQFKDLIYARNTNSNKLYGFNMDGNIENVLNDDIKFDFTNCCLFIEDEKGNRIMEEPIKW